MSFNKKSKSTIKTENCREHVKLQSKCTGWQSTPKNQLNVKLTNFFS